MGSKIVLPEIIGLPPEDNNFKNDGAKTLPIIQFEPRIPDQSGMAFRLKPYFKVFRDAHPDPNQKPPIPSYLEILGKYGYTFDIRKNTTGLKCAYIADSFPTDNFTNEYSESFLNTLARGTSRVGAELSQTFGATEATELYKKVSEKLKNNEYKLLEWTGDVMDVAGTGLGKIIGGLSSLAEKGGLGFVNTFFSEANKLLAGGRLDFPKIWSGCNFEPSYSVTIRLFNPDPSDIETTKKYIIGPIASILILALPIKNRGSETYRWPFFNRIHSPGIFDLRAGVITNVTVIKGGEQHQIAFNQRLGMVDIRVDFSDLYNSMITTVDEELNEERPTLKNYLEAMEGSKEFYLDRYYTDIIETNSYPQPIDTNNANPTSRVADETKNTYDNLKGSQPNIP